MPGDFRCDRGDYARVLFSFAREVAGASSARHSLRPLLLGAANQFLQNSGEIAPRDRGAMNFSRHCERSEVIHRQSNGDNGLLRRGACHRARVRATRWLLAMTVPNPTPLALTVSRSL